MWRTWTSPARSSSIIGSLSHTPPGPVPSVCWRPWRRERPAVTGERRVVLVDRSDAVFGPPAVTDGVVGCFVDPPVRSIGGAGSALPWVHDTARRAPGGVDQPDPRLHLLRGGGGRGVRRTGARAAPAVLRQSGCAARCRGPRTRGGDLLQLPARSGAGRGAVVLGGGVSVGHPGGSDARRRPRARIGVRRRGIGGHRRRHRARAGNG